MAKKAWLWIWKAPKQKSCFSRKLPLQMFLSKASVLGYWLRHNTCYKSWHRLLFPLCFSTRRTREKQTRGRQSSCRIGKCPLPYTFTKRRFRPCNYWRCYIWYAVISLSIWRHDDGTLSTSCCRSGLLDRRPGLTSRRRCDLKKISGVWICKPIKKSMRNAVLILFHIMSIVKSRPI